MTVERSYVKDTTRALVFTRSPGKIHPLSDKNTLAILYIHENVTWASNWGLNQSWVRIWSSRDAKIVGILQQSWDNVVDTARGIKVAGRDYFNGSNSIL